MLPSKTVFVVGAGASNEVGLPVGTALRSIIASKLDLSVDFFKRVNGQGDPAIHEALIRHLQRDLGKAIEACARIRKGLVLSSSIDDFIDAHRGDPYIALCGKLAIASAILEAERNSKLFFQRTHIDDTINFAGIENTWYVGFYRLLTQQVSRDQLDSLFKNISVITFNYDRCIEHFLTHAIATNYHLPTEVASKLVQALPIYRPYGSVGPYVGQHDFDFGAKRPLEVDVVIKNVRTYTERIEDRAGLDAIRSAISDAKVIVFLGFAFHANNMRVLGKENLYPPTKRIYATRMGISDSDLEVIQNQLTRLCGLAGGQFHFTAESRRCADLFNQYQLSLRQ